MKRLKFRTKKIFIVLADFDTKEGIERVRGEREELAKK